PAGFRNRLIRGAAVQGHGQDARHGRFPDSPVPAEDVTMRRAPLLNGIFQGACNMLLADHLGEFLRPVLAGKNLIAHIAGIVDYKRYWIAACSPCGYFDPYLRCSKSR